MKSKTLKLSVCIFILLVIYGVAQENKLVINDRILNGDFEQDLNISWQTFYKDYSGSSEIYRDEIENNHFVYLQKDWCGYAELFQIIKLENLNQNLSVRLNLNAISNREGYSALSAFIIRFLNKDNKVLAETRIAYSTNKLINNPILYNYPTKPDEWKTHTLNLKDELATHFAKVDVGQIKKFKISLYTFNNETSGC